MNTLIYRLLLAITIFYTTPLLTGEVVKNNTEVDPSTQFTLVKQGIPLGDLWYTVASPTTEITAYKQKIVSSTHGVQYCYSALIHHKGGTPYLEDDAKTAQIIFDKIASGLASKSPIIIEL